MSDSAERQKSRFTPSSAGIWSVCPRAAKHWFYGEMPPREPSPALEKAAEIGQAKHEMAAWAIRSADEAELQKHLNSEVLTRFGIAKLAKGEREVISEVWGEYRGRGRQRVELEVKFNIAVGLVKKTNVPNRGFIDFAVWETDSGKLTILDWKFGRGIVPIKNNAQMLLYANTLLTKGVKIVELRIVQPSNKDWRLERELLTADAVRAMKPEPSWPLEGTEGEECPPEAGAHCAFCPLGMAEACKEGKPFAWGFTPRSKPMTAAEAAADFNACKTMAYFNHAITHETEGKKA